jgi:SEC-C motif
MPLHAHPKAGRNDLCPCGSGKKFKRCCLLAIPASDSSPWKDQRDASGRLSQALLSFAMQKFAEDIPDAWLDFNQDESPLPIEEDASEGQIFIPYLLFDWDMGPRRRRMPPPGGGLVARTYLLKHPDHLSELERLILEQAVTQPISFYEVLRSDPGEGVRLRDVLIGGETEVTERTASQTLRPGDRLRTTVSAA